MPNHKWLALSGARIAKFAERQSCSTLPSTISNACWLLLYDSADWKVLTALSLWCIVSLSNNEHSAAAKDEPDIGIPWTWTKVTSATVLIILRSTIKCWTNTEHFWDLFMVKTMALTRSKLSDKYAWHLIKVQLNCFWVVLWLSDLPLEKGTKDWTPFCEASGKLHDLKPSWVGKHNERDQSL